VPHRCTDLSRDAFFRHCFTAFFGAGRKLTTRASDCFTVAVAFSFRFLPRQAFTVFSIWTDTLATFAIEFFSRAGHRWCRGGRGDDHRRAGRRGTVTRSPDDRFPARDTGDGALHELGLSDEQIPLAQLVERIGDQILACPDELDKASQIVLAVAMPPHARCDRAQAMSGVAPLIVEKKLLANRLFKKTVPTCSW
jgi:hypothetical protein